MALALWDDMQLKFSRGVDEIAYGAAMKALCYMQAEAVGNTSS